MTKGELARKLHMRIGELDPVLRELERTGKIRMTEIDRRFKKKLSH
jgi:hypothetical protein